MRPHLCPRALGAAVLAALPCSIGCAPQGARTFSVVLEEPAYLQCTPTLTEAAINYEELFYLLNQLPDAWQQQYESGQLRPTGGRLHTFTSEGETSAWFDDFQQSPYYQWNSVVFSGEPNEGFLDVSNVVSHDTGITSPGAGDQSCGVLVDTKSTLLATIDGATLEGRVRRIEITYFSAGFSACAAWIACARNIALRGAEER